MKNVLVLGAGMVAKPCIRHLLEEPSVHLVVADCHIEKAQAAVGSHPRAKALKVEAGEASDLIHQADIVVSLLPSSFQAQIARSCIEARKPMVHAGYVGSMLNLHDEASRAGVLILGEMGVDPGIDHMLAKRTIDQIHAGGGSLESFGSWCGAIPAPESNTNPFGYKISWSPLDLLGASVRPARYLRDSQEISIPGDQLFKAYEFHHVEGLGWFEDYPNGDALRYRDLYGVPGVSGIYRGTLRYVGWCETLAGMVDLGLLDDTRRDLSGLTYRGLARKLLGCPESRLEDALTRRLGSLNHHCLSKRLQWLGLLEEKPLPIAEGSHRDVVAHLMWERLRYDPGERDLLVMKHEFVAEYPGGRRTRATSTLVAFGTPGQDSALATTTGLPVAIGCRMLLRGEIDLTGVHIPVEPCIYEPALAELERLGIAPQEECQDLETR